jgi:serine/threonine protein kinase/Tol biopolymer transport system component
MIAGYRIDGLLGRGGMGVVYRAEHLRLHRPVALKLLAPEIAEDERFRARFLRESELAASIDHPNIIPIYDAGEEQGLLFIAMRHVGGTDLRTLMREAGRLPPERALSIIRQIADALDHAHAHGLVHRDVKPGNILVVSDPADHCYLCDFGLTKSAGSIADPASSGHLAGTVDYVAPEQITGAGADARSDLYSLACVAWECLTGAPPFRRDSDLATLWAHVNDAPPSIDPALGLPLGVDAVLQRGLSKRSADRQDTSRQLAAGLADAVVGVTEQIVAAPPSAPRVPRSKTVIGAIVAAVLALAALAGLAWWSSSRPSASPPPVPVKRAPKPVPNAIVRIDPATLKLTTTRLDRRPGPMLATAAGLWVADEGARELWLIDPDSGDVKEKVPLEGTPTGLASQGDVVWVAEGFKRQLERFNADGNLIKRLPLDPTEVCCRGAWSVAAGTDSLWIGSGSGVVGVDQNTGDIVKRPTLGGSVAMLTVKENGGDKEALWSTNGWQAFKMRIPSGEPNPVTIRTLEGSSGRPTAIAANSRWLWIAATSADDLQRVPLSGKPNLNAPSIEVDSPTAVAVGAGAIWVASAKTGTVWRVDPASGRPSQVAQLELRIIGIAVSGGSVWITTGEALDKARPDAALANQSGHTLRLPGFPADKRSELVKATMPAWSPDGTQIAFSSNRDGDWDIYRVNADGSDLHNLTNRDAKSDLAPSWSPDGSQIVYASNYYDNYDIWTMRSSDGLDAITRIQEPGYDSFPAWSPDGTTIAYLSDNGGTVPVQAFTIADGDDQPQPVDRNGGPSGAPVWSPDGASVAFWSNINGGGIVIAQPGRWVQVLSGVKVAGHGSNPVPVSWSPDGRYIAYSAPAAGHGHTIWVMYADGNGSYPLAGLGNSQYPAWRPELR